MATERAFAVVAAALVLAWATTALVAPTDATSGDDGLAFEPPVPEEYAFDSPTADGVARVDGGRFASVGAALAAAEAGDTVVLAGHFDERVVVRTPDVTLASAVGRRALIEGDGRGTVLTIAADGVTLRGVWVANSGNATDENDAGIWVDGSDVRLVDNRVTRSTFGIWLDGGANLTVRDNTVVGREAVRPLSYRGNGIQVWKVEDSRIEDNRITDVRDGIYYSWAAEVVGRNNTMWDLRYGVHYMYSDDCTLVNNTAFDDDVGFALMVSRRLVLRGNVAVNNTGTSGHGILLKSVDETVVHGNDLVGNDRGLYVYNSLDNRIDGNLVLGNDVGVHLTAGSVRETVADNSFIRNDAPVKAVVGEQVAWNRSDRGNYWAGARTADVDRDGVSEVRYQPAGLVERLVHRRPLAGTFEASPAFDVVRLAESTIPVVESPGVVDHHPLVRPPHREWRRYYE